MRASGKVGPERLRRGVTEDRRVGQKIVGLTELHAVEEIVEFKAHVESQALVNSFLLIEDHIGVVDAGPAEVIAAQIAAGTKR